jgi:hypothetical protein
MTIQQSRQRLTEAEEAYKTAQPGRDLTVARQELTDARGEYHAACADVVDRLDSLLGPFALEADKWALSAKDSHELILDDQDALEFTLGDLRALAKLWDEVR